VHAKSRVPQDQDNKAPTQRAYHTFDRACFCMASVPPSRGPKAWVVVVLVLRDADDGELQYMSQARLLRRRPSQTCKVLPRASRSSPAIHSRYSSNSSQSCPTVYSHYSALHGSAPDSKKRYASICASIRHARVSAGLGYNKRCEACHATSLIRLRPETLACGLLLRPYSNKKVLLGTP
jgi:hypothetical protein